MYFIVTCEHATNAIPRAYQAYFQGAKSALDSHRGLDFGALHIALEIQKKLSAPLFKAEVSRLLVDCNRSLHHQDLFSEWSGWYSSSEKQLILEQFYFPYRKNIEAAIQHEIQKQRPIIHLSIHSFTPVLDQIERQAEIGLLFDPKRQREQSIARRIQQLLIKQDLAYRIRMNYPYKGNSDGLTTYLRQRFSADGYMGLEIEVNQALVMQKNALNRISQALSETFIQLKNELDQMGMR